MPTQVRITPHSITTEGENSHQILTRMKVDPPDWSHHLQIHSPLSHPWDLHYQLESAGSIVFLATDGGANKGKGYFGWVVASQQQLLWEGSGTIPSHSSQINSLRPEASSHLAVLKFLQDYMSSHKTRVSATITHIVDNNSQVRRAEFFNQGREHTPKSITRSDMDLQLQIESTLEDMYKSHHSTVVSHHVKGHSDQLIGPPTWKEHLNILADSLATSSESRPKPPECSFPASVATLWHGEIQITKQLRKAIDHRWATETYETYIRGKYSWDHDTVKSIEGSTGPHRLLTTSERIFNASYSHHWLPLNATLHSRKVALTPLCPVCGRQPETLQHFLYCEDYPLNTLQTLRGKLATLSRSTDGGLTSLLWKALLHSLTGHFQTEHLNLPREYWPLIIQQERIGWFHLWLGRWSSRWKTSALPDTNQATQNSRIKWIKHTKLSVLRYAHSKWKERSAIMDGDPHRVIRCSLVTKIERLYAVSHRFPSRYQFLFNTPLETLRESPTSQLKYWIRKNSNLLQRYLREKKKTTGPMDMHVRVRKQRKRHKRRHKPRMRISPEQAWEELHRSRRKPPTGIEKEKE